MAVTRPLLSGNYHTVYAPTDIEIIKTMLKMLKLKRGEVLYDFGSGDGRILIEAAKRYGTIGVGIELDTDLFFESYMLIEEDGLVDRIKIRQGDVLDSAISFRDADAVTMYLLPELIEALKPKLEEQLQPECRVVSELFPVHGWEFAKEKKTSWIGRAYLYKMDSI